ncbi:MAG TPA: endopeptidase La, partial [Bacteroidetes bacterium]|nr:endopeptidase La [Bacteroidota bacterium]
FPAGGIPKDGPSAGIAILTAMGSSLSQRLVAQKLAMTGEITLRGKVLPVGGIKEKFLAARRAGIQTVILCKQNKKDISEIDQAYTKDLNIIYVDRMEEVLGHTLEPLPIKNAIDLMQPVREADKEKKKRRADFGESGAMIKH